MNIAGGPPGGGGNVPMHPQFGYHGMPMGGGAGHMPFMNPGMSGGPPFLPPPGPPMSQPSAAAASHHVPPGSGSVVLVSNLDPEVNRSFIFASVLLPVIQEHSRYYPHNNIITVWHGSADTAVRAVNEVNWTCKVAEQIQ